jgi:AraC family transcriptional regulator
MPALRYSPTFFPAPIVRRRAAGDFLLTETRYGSEAALQTHAHEYACLVVVLEGNFRERYNAKMRVVQPGTVIVRPEGEPHSDRFERGGGRCLNVELPPQWLARMRGLTQLLDRSGAYRGGAFTLAGRRLHAELMGGDDLSPLAVESLILGLFADAAREERRAPSGAPRWLVDVRERMRDDVGARVSLADLAASAGVHPVHLATTFRRYYGATVAAYLRQLRIEFACRELAETNATLADIALVAGFADQSHFGRTFKQAMHTTPSAYRAAMRGVPSP